jgi:hypothetical protein
VLGFWRRPIDLLTPVRSPAALAGLTVYLAVPNRSILCSSRRRQNKTPNTSHDMLGALFWRRPTLARPIAVLPSGLQRFTSVFGMGTGGATALLSPECGAALAVSLRSQRRKREAESLETRAIEVNRPYLDRISKELSTLSSQPSTDALIRWHLHTGVRKLRVAQRRGYPPSPKLRRDRQL